MQRERGLTLLEVLTVLSIVAILAALAFPAMAPSREKARQTRCASQLRQIHGAMMQYAADHPGTEEIPGLEGVPVAPYVYTPCLRPYLRQEDVLWCPNATSEEKRFHGGGSYAWMYIHPSLVDPKGGVPRWLLDKQAREIEEKGSNYPLLVCFTHDQTYYYPREDWMDPAFTHPFVLELRVAGNVVAGRRPYMRGYGPWHRR